MITKTFATAADHDRRTAATARRAALPAQLRDELGALALREAADRLHGEIRHWLRILLTFTRPYFGTARSMSKTFAVST